MSQKLLRRSIAVVAAAALAFSLAACSTSTDAGSTSSSDTSASDAFPVTIQSALGNATIESKPKRVVTIGWGAADDVVALGTTPVGIEEVTWGGDSEKNYPWVTAAIKKRGDELPKTFAVYPDIDMTALAELNPDVIIAPQSGITAKQYKTLSALAPTVAYPGEAWGTSWSDELTIVGKALGESDLAAQKIAGIKETLAKTAAANPEFAKYNFTYIYAAEPGSLSIYQKGDPRVDIIAGLGLTPEATAAAIPKTAGTFVSTVGLEKANVLDKTDIVFTWFNDEANEKEIEKQALYKTIPAVERGSYVANVDQQLAMASTVITPLSLPYALDKYVAKIKAAAAKVD